MTIVVTRKGDEEREGGEERKRGGGVERERERGGCRERETRNMSNATPRKSRKRFLVKR